MQFYRLYCLYSLNMHKLSNRELNFWFFKMYSHLRLSDLSLVSLEIMYIYTNNNNGDATPYSKIENDKSKDKSNVPDIVTIHCIMSIISTVKIILIITQLLENLSLPPIVHIRGFSQIVSLWFKRIVKCTING